MQNRFTPSSLHAPGTPFSKLKLIICGFWQDNKIRYRTYPDNPGQVRLLKKVGAIRSGNSGRSAMNSELSRFALLTICTDLM
jgi:hypothetical protein